MGKADMEKELSGRAYKLSKRAIQIKHTLESLASNRALSPEFCKLTMLNEGIKTDVLDNAFHMNCVSRREINHVLGYLALQKKDLLAMAIMERDTSDIRCSIDYVLTGSNILAKLLTRRMTEQEYSGYLNGKITIGTWGGQEIYLSPQVQAECQEVTVR